ncbi:MAG: thiamine diphosphokinase [Lachnospiraceae bacterium]|nr:thiamine diphosphokinase [Lachnospiraceae bacterium]
MNGTCLIISGGEFSQIPDAFRSADFVIACDKGWLYAKDLGLSPNLIIGDFDSSPLPTTEIPIERVPTRKDDTDTMLAVRRALEMGYGNILICCAFGVRLDHAFANLQAAAYIAAHGAKARLVGTDTDAYVYANSSERFPKKDGWSLSVFALSDVCRGVSICGTKYACENVTLTNAFPLGVSNSWALDMAEISVQSGILLVMQSKLRKGEHI